MFIPIIVSFSTILYYDMNGNAAFCQKYQLEISTINVCGKYDFFCSRKVFRSKCVSLIACIVQEQFYAAVFWSGYS